LRTFYRAAKIDSIKEKKHWQHKTPLPICSGWMVFGIAHEIWSASPISSMHEKTSVRLNRRAFNTFLASGRFRDPQPFFRDN